MVRSLSNIEEHAFFILFLGFVLILFWHAVWELLTELTDLIHRRHGIPKWKMYVGSLIFVILVIGLYPQILEKI
jgi:hypothetical protein